MLPSSSPSPCLPPLSSPLQRTPRRPPPLLAVLYPVNPSPAALTVSMLLVNHPRLLRASRPVVNRPSFSPVQLQAPQIHPGPQVSLTRAQRLRPQACSVLNRPTRSHSPPVSIPSADRPLPPLLQNLLHYHRSPIITDVHSLPHPIQSKRAHVNRPLSKSQNYSDPPSRRHPEFRRRTG